MDMDIWVVSTSNQLFIRCSYLNWKKTIKNIKPLLEKLCSLWQVHVVLNILLIILASGRAVLYRNFAFLNFTLNKKKYSSFLKKFVSMQLFRNHTSVWVLSVLKETPSGTASSFTKFYYRCFFRILWKICNLINWIKH